MLKDKPLVIKRNQIKISYEENHYEKIKMIGKGTFGKVFKVHIFLLEVINKKNNKQYALKEVVQDSKYKNRQLNIIAQMDHPNIIEMKDYFFSVENCECILHILMDYMDTNLATLLKEQRKRKQPLPLPIRKVLAFQLFKGLYYLSMNNVCHRDLKPPNILINCRNCELKICDFGSAKIIETKENNVSYICSRYYRAPELILNSSTYGCQVDMWSAGCILVEFMCLQPIFPGDSSIQQLIEIIKICGTPKKKHIAKFSKENSQIELPKLKSADIGKILARYKPQQTQLDLIRKILTFDIEGRLTPYEALMHPYFKDLMKFQEAKGLSDLLDFQSLKTKANRKEIKLLEQFHRNDEKECDDNKQNCGESETASSLKAKGDF